MSRSRRSLVCIATLALPACLASPDFFGGEGGGSGRRDAGPQGAGAGGSAGGYGTGGTGGVAGAGGSGGVGGSAAGGGLAAGGGIGGGPPDAGTFTQVRASRSSSVAVSGASRYAVNPDLDLLSVSGSFVTQLQLPAGSQPVALAVMPDGQSAVIALKKSQELAMVTGLPAAPRLAWRVRVCSEPAGVALSPTARTAVVACLGEPVAILVDTTTVGVQSVALGGVARGVAVTNDGDLDDTDEHAYLPLFFGAPLAEASDTGRRGAMVELDLGTRMVSAQIPLGPIMDTGFGPTLSDGGEGPHVACSPNQLYAIAVAQGRAWVTHTCVSPQPPLQKVTTVFSGLSVIDLATHAEVVGPDGSTTLNALARMTMNPAESLLGVPIDVDVDPQGLTLAVLSQAAARVAFLNVMRGAPIMPLFGPIELSMPLQGAGGCTYPMMNCFDGGFGFDGGVDDLDGVPIGLVMSGMGHTTVNDLTGRKLTDQLGPVSATAMPYAPAPPVGSPEHELALGKKFFFTGQGRWSFRDVGSCGSCHPDGLSDNVTWVFGAGPRQTPALDGTFAKGNALDHRAQNWTAIFDEVYDVEGVTRNVLGGRGALVYGMDVPISLSGGLTFDGGVTARNDNLSGSTRAVNDGFSVVKDWKQVELYVQQIEPNRAPMWADVNSVQRGRQVFTTAGCASCHGGPKWTVSRVPYVPDPAKNGSLPGDNGLPSAVSGLRTELRDGGSWQPYNRDTLKVAVEKLPNPDGGADLSNGPERITCVLRDVGTYDAMNVREKKTDGTAAQGAMGFNPPSLLSVAATAPYLHHGEATTLVDLFAPRYAAHYHAGNVSFDPTPAQVADLVAFLKSIDEATPPYAAADTVDLCGGY